MTLTNLSAEAEGKVRSWLPHDLVARDVVFFPDACPGRAPLPTGTVVRIDTPDWRRYAVSDCGCGMLLLSSCLDLSALTPDRWNRVADNLRSNKGKLGDLGGGNHFLDALVPAHNGPLHFLIHTGSRSESGLVDHLIDRPSAFDAVFAHTVGWARENREAVQKVLEAVFGRLEVVLDLPHNTYELESDGRVVIRKGAVRVQPGELNVIPSHVAGGVALVCATVRVTEVLNSLSHGTGRKLPRGEAKKFAAHLDFDALRQQVLMPDGLQNDSMRTEGPFAYRDLDECLLLLDGYVEEVERFRVVGYMGHL